MWGPHPPPIPSSFPSTRSSSSPSSSPHTLLASHLTHVTSLRPPGSRVREYGDEAGERRRRALDLGWGCRRRARDERVLMYPREKDGASTDWWRRRFEKGHEGRPREVVAGKCEGVMHVFDLDWRVLPHLSWCDIGFSILSCGASATFSSPYVPTRNGIHGLSKIYHW